MRRKGSADSEDPTGNALVLSEQSSPTHHRLPKHTRLAWLWSMSRNSRLTFVACASGSFLLLLFCFILPLVPVLAAPSLAASRILLNSAIHPDNLQLGLRNSLAPAHHRRKRFSTASANPLAGPEPEPKASCPLEYSRLSVKDITHGHTPYLFGGRQKPQCKNCHLKHNLWSNFCQYKSHGQLCNPRDTKWLIQTYINRNWTELLTLTPCDFWPFLKGRTTWVMGDSQALDFYKALKCFMYEFWDLEADEKIVLNNATHYDIISKYLTPSCVTMPQSSRICYIRFDPGTYLFQGILPIFPDFADRKDVAIINFGLHHGTMENYQKVLGSFEAYVRTNNASLPQFFWQETSAQHFKGWLGEYPGGSPPFQCQQIEGLKLLPDGSLESSVEQTNILLHGGWRNRMANEVMQNMGIPIIHSYNETVPLYYYHRDNGKGYECTHFCFPSAQQTWVYNLYKSLITFYNHTSFVSSEAR